MSLETPPTPTDNTDKADKAVPPAEANTELGAGVLSPAEPVRSVGIAPADAYTREGILPKLSIVALARNEGPGSAEEFKPVESVGPDKLGERTTTTIPQEIKIKAIGSSGPEVFGAPHPKVVQVGSVEPRVHYPEELRPVGSVGYKLGERRTTTKLPQKFEKIGPAELEVFGHPHPKKVTP